MQWRGGYELLEPIAGAARSFHGRESGSSTPVIIHLLEARDQPSSRATLHAVMSLPPDAFAHVRDIGEHEGAAYVITDGHFGEAPLEEWLRRARIGEERYSGAAKWPIATPGEAIEKTPASEFIPLLQAPKTPPQPTAGEFTRLFQAPSAAKPLQAPLVAAALPPSPPESEQGEFTRLFSSPLAPEPAKPAPVQSDADITRLFQRRPGAAGLGGLPDVPARPAEPPSTPAPAPQSPAEPVGDFTRLLGASMPNPLSPMQPKPPAPASPAPPPVPIASSGNYTRVVSGRPPTPATSPALPPAEAPPMNARANITPIVVFSALAVLALALILLFAIWH